MINMGANLSITSDIDGDARDSMPDIGADELMVTMPGTFAFSSSTYSIAENGGTATITVSRSGGSDGAVTVDYAATGLTATGGASCTGSTDFILTSGTLSFANGETSKTFNVTVCDDAVNESNESVALSLTNPTGGATIGSPNPATLTINDNDPPPTFQFSSATYSNSDDLKGLAPEAATITVTRTGSTTEAVSVDYATVAGGSATGGLACGTGSGIDYVNAGGTLNFASGETSKTFNITVCADSRFEGNETVNLALSNPTSPAVLGTPNTAVLTIIDNDAQPSLQFSSATYSVGESASFVTITVTRTGAVDNAVGVDYANVAGGMATAGASCGGPVDFVNASGTLTFNAGVVSQTFNVTICNDNVLEADESFDLSLSNATGGAAIGSPSTAAVTITNDDATFQFSSATYAGNEGTTVVATVTRVGYTGGAGTVDYTTSNGTAGGGTCGPAGEDFEAASGTLSWMAGDATAKTININLCGDPFSESPAESVGLTLSNATGGALGSPGTSTITIYDVASEFTNSSPLNFSGGQTVSSVITVDGYTGAMLGVRVSLTGVTAPVPDNIDVLLVDPDGTAYVLMGDTGGANALTGATLTFEDTAGQSLPDAAAITVGQNYKPTNCLPGVTTFGGGAPSAPYIEPGCGPTLSNTMASAFGGMNPNGNWTLYVRDDNGVDPLGATNSIGGWGIQFLLPTAAPVSVSGRVLTASGAGIRNARVTLTGGGLSEPLVTFTGTFGFYSFEGLEAGGTYVVTVEPRRYVIAQPVRVVTVVDDIVGLDFIAQPRE